MSVDIETIIQKYVALRDDIERVDAEAKAKKAPLVAAMETLGNVLLKLANDQGVTSFKTGAGTAFRQTVTRASVQNSDEFFEHLRASGDFHLLTKAVNKTAVQDYINTHEKPPPGVGWTVMHEMQVRRS
jgi:hypothetical protein